MGGTLIDSKTCMLGTECNIVLSQTCKYLRFRCHRVDFCTMHAYFDVEQCSTRLDVIENLGVGVGVASLSCSQPDL